MKGFAMYGGKTPDPRYEQSGSLPFNVGEIDHFQLPCIECRRYIQDAECVKIVSMTCAIRAVRGYVKGIDSAIDQRSFPANLQT